MLYSRSQIFNKLNSLLEYSKNNYTLPVSYNNYGYGYSTSSTMNSEVQSVKTAFYNYINKDKGKIAKQIHELLKTYMWFKDARYQKCENDDYLGIYISDVPELYWMQNWPLITTNGCFNFATIMNTSNETFLSNWYVSSTTSSGVQQIYVLKNHLIDSWIPQINLKREKELQNIKDAIDYMENNYSEVDDMLDIFENRGEVIGTDPLITKVPKPVKKVLVRTITGDRVETVQNSDNEYDFISEENSIESIAAMIYLTDYYGLFWIILGLELYNENDFSAGSKPVSTYGPNKVYIPSYLKENFKNLLNNI
jgi:hypothetical protein